LVDRGYFNDIHILLPQVALVLREWQMALDEISQKYLRLSQKSKRYFSARHDHQESFRCHQISVTQSIALDFRD
jgi:hypothetical protein